MGVRPPFLQRAKHASTPRVDHHTCITPNPSDLGQNHKRVCELIQALERLDRRLKVVTFRLQRLRHNAEDDPSPVSWEGPCLTNVVNCWLLYPRTYDSPKMFASLSLMYSLLYF